MTQYFINPDQVTRIEIYTNKPAENIYRTHKYRFLFWKVGMNGWFDSYNDRRYANELPDEKYIVSNGFVYYRPFIIIYSSDGLNISKYFYDVDKLEEFLKLPQFQKLLHIRKQS